MQRNKEDIDKIKWKYPKGTQICMLEFDDVENIPSGTIGTVESVDDHGQIHMKWDFGKKSILVLGEYQFEITQDAEEERSIKVIIIEPDNHPRIEIIKDSLKVKQSIIGGYSKALYFDDGAILICNDIGKLIGLKANRKVGSDIIAGTFFIVGDDGSENYASLSNEQIERYMKQFYKIEHHNQEDLLFDSMCLYSLN